MGVLRPTAKALEGLHPAQRCLGWGCSAHLTHEGKPRKGWGEASHSGPAAHTRGLSLWPTLTAAW